MIINKKKKQPKDLLTNDVNVSHLVSFLVFLEDWVVENIFSIQ